MKYKYIKWSFPFMAAMMFLSGCADVEEENDDVEVEDVEEVEE